jgi:tight adherence protein B
MNAELTVAALAGVAAWIAAAPSPAARRLRVLADDAAPPPSASVMRRVGAAVRELRGRRRRSGERRAAVIELCDGVGAELAAGRTPEMALHNAARFLGRPELRTALAAAPGDDIAARLDRMAELPGAEGLRLLAGCWRIGAERGGMFGGVVDGLAAALRDEQAHRAEAAAQLAGPRATARLLAALPLLGLAMGAALGARPLVFLFGTVPGAACLLAGVALDAIGFWWTRRLVTGAEAPR